MAKRPADALGLGAPGGHRQKYRWCEQAEQAAEETRPSALAKLLLDQWSWGLMPATMVQKLAQAAVEDDVTKPDIIKLAKLGSGGRYPNHCHGDLVDKLNILPMQDALSSINVFYKLPGAHHRVLSVTQKLAAS